MTLLLSRNNPNLRHHSTVDKGHGSQCQFSRMKIGLPASSLGSQRRTSRLLRLKKPDKQKPSTGAILMRLFFNYYTHKGIRELCLYEKACNAFAKGQPFGNEIYIKPLINRYGWFAGPEHCVGYPVANRLKLTMNNVIYLPAQ